MRRAGPEATAAELRAAFDRSFSLPIETEHEATHELLGVRARGVSLALSVPEIGGVLRCPPLTAVPSRNPALAGLAGVRGALVAVYELSEVAARGRGAPAGVAAPGGWIVVCADDRSVALRFDELDGYERVPASAVRGDGAERLATLAGIPRAVVDVAAVLETIRRIARAGADKER